MKTKSLWIAAFLVLATLARAATNDLASWLQTGLFEEEGNRNLTAAMAAYQLVITQHDKDRALAATAVFRLGECYRKLGQTNEAVAQYNRILSDFTDQATLVMLSRQNLTGLGGGGAAPAQSPENALRAMLQSKRSAEAEMTDEEQQEIRRIQAMIQNSPDLINAASGGLTPLLNAATKGQLVVAAYLLDHGALPDVPAGSDVPLCAAARNGHKAMVELLLSHGAKVNSYGKGLTPLVEAVSHGFGGVVDVLLANGADVNQIANNQTPLFYAVGKGNETIMRQLLDKGADVNAKNSDLKSTPLHWAVQNGNENILRELLSRGAQVNATNSQGLTPLHLSAERPNTNLSAILVNAHADLAVRDGGGDTPLMKAVQSQNTGVVQLFLDKGAEVDGINNQAITPLLEAIRRGKPEILRALLEHKANPNLAGTMVNWPERRTMSGAQPGPGMQSMPSLGGMLYSSPRTITARPLYFAISARSVELVKLLLDFGADPADSEGPTKSPLVQALMDQQPEIIRLLLDHHADPNQLLTDGQTLLRYSLGLPELVKLLLEAGADPNQQGTMPQPVLVVAASWDGDAKANLKNMVALLNHGAQINAVDSTGNTALHEAVFKAQTDIISLLVSNQADLNIQNRQGNTPLDIALSMQDGRANYALLVAVTSWSPQNVDTNSVRAMLTLLRARGAMSDLPRLDRIEVCRPSASYSKVELWRKDTLTNQFSLLELVAIHYSILRLTISEEAEKQPPPMGSAPSGLAFPDFAGVVIHRPAPDGKRRETIPVNLAEIFTSGDCARDPTLQWGDIIEIPERDHPVSEQGNGLPMPDIIALAKCVSRNITIIIKGTATPVAVSIVEGNGRSRLGLQTVSCMLRSVLDRSKLIRYSSDLTRVKVTRRDAATSKTAEWTFDCSDPGKSPAFWLHDGDVIEVPEKPGL